MVLANTISPTLVAVPGFALLGLHVAFTLSLLAAFIERPFVTKAGVPRHALCLSLQANFVTTLVGLLCTPIALLMLVFPPLLLVWWPYAAWLSYRVEYARYRRCVKDEGIELKRSPVLWGNVVSNVVFMILLLITPLPSNQRIFWLHSLEPWLTLSTVAVCLAAYLAAFLIPVARRNCPARVREVAMSDAPGALHGPQVF